MVTIRRFTFSFILFLSSAFIVISQEPPASSAAGATKEIWGESRIAGQPAGSYHEQTEIGRDNHIRTSIDSDFILNRLGSKVEMRSTSQYEESGDGHLLAIHNDMSSSAETTHMDVTVAGAVLLVRTTAGAKTYERTVSFTGTLLGPAGSRRLSLSQLKSSGDTISWQTFYPELGTIATVTNTLTGWDRVNVGAENEQGMKLQQSISGMPGKATLWVDSSGWLLRESQASPFGEIEIVRTQKQQAANVPGASLSNEVFTRTVVRSNIRLPEERLIERVKIRITHRKPELGWPDFEAANQKVLEKAPDHVVLEVEQPEPRVRTARPAQSTPATASFLAPNALLQSDDATVQSIAAKIVRHDNDLFRSARALQTWTNENMHFDPGIAVVPASEVVHDRRGTCLGYSILLASLARAAGIPSRIRMGFVYAGGIWGGHAWVDVLVGRDWIPLDAALYSPGPADAARFSLFTSALEEGTISQIGTLAQLFGNVDIQILEYEVNGKRILVPADAKPFSIDADTYRNPWLGLTVVKPSSFRFEKLDAVWPETTVIAMKGPGQQRVEIESLSDSLPTSTQPAKKYLSDAGISGSAREENIAGHRALVISSPEKAGVVLLNGGDIWLIKATGPQASELLAEVASTLRLANLPENALDYSTTR